MQQNPKPREDSSTSHNITRVAANTFVGVLVGLVLKTSLDTFFRNASSYSNISSAATAVFDRGLFSIIVILQLLIFLFTLVRFYLGSFRYHQKEPDISGAAEMAIDLVGMFGVFVSFYITAIFVRNTNLFYLGFGLIQIVDLVWFMFARARLNLSPGMINVAGWYLFFDVITLIVLVVFFLLEEYGGSWPSYLPQWFALAGVLAIGIWDLVKLWPFYAGSPDWPASLRDAYFTNRILTLRRRYERNN